MAKHRLLEIQFQFIAQVSAAEDLTAPAAATATAEDVTEDFPKDVAEGLAGIHSRAAVLLV